MRYTLTTMTSPQGIFFARHELQPAGIHEDSHCWGVWFQGRDIDTYARANDNMLARNQSPHLVISPIHPNLWPVAFTVRAMLQLRGPEDGMPPRRWDAVYGLSDALSRCGVNILFVQTAQIGYDLIAYTAICELPYLRDLVAPLLQQTDSAGQRMAEWRVRPGMRSPDAQVNEDRSNALKSLGSLLLPRLAALELRLGLIDEWRRKHWLARRDGDAVRRVEDEFVQDALFQTIVGTPPPADGSREQAFSEALSAAWFFNTKCVDAGENMYYLDYALFESLVTSRLSPGSESNGNVAGDLPPAALLFLYREMHGTLIHRPPSVALKNLGVPPAARQRGASVSVDQFAREEARSYFRRQAYTPVSISPLTYLAHARFSAFVDVNAEYVRVPFKYRNGQLLPQRQQPDHAAKDAPGALGHMDHIYGFLNGLARRRDEYGPGSVVFASVDPQDSYLRLRFESASHDARYLNLEISYSVTDTGPDESSSKGLLRTLSELMHDKGLRIERASNKITRSNKTFGTATQFIEEGTVSLTLSAITVRRASASSTSVASDADVWLAAEGLPNREEAGLALISWLANLGEASTTAVCDVWLRQMEKRESGPWRLIKATLNLGPLATP
jgi:hypothetical protein